jgi:uncharacterized protein (TIGR03435 family)
MYSGSSATWRGRNKKIASLANDLSVTLDAPVMDATGLEGEYDYTLTFSPEIYRGPASNIVRTPSSGGASAAAAGAEVSPEHPLLLDALQE